MRANDDITHRLTPCDPQDPDCCEDDGCCGSADDCC